MATRDEAIANGQFHSIPQRPDPQQWMNCKQAVEAQARVPVPPRGAVGAAYLYGPPEPPQGAVGAAELYDADAGPSVETSTDSDPWPVVVLTPETTPPLDPAEAEELAFLSSLSSSSYSGTSLAVICHDDWYDCIETPQQRLITKGICKQSVRGSTSLNLLEDALKTKVFEEGGGT